MAIQLPDIQRMGPQAPESVGRGVQDNRAPMIDNTFGDLAVKMAPTIEDKINAAAKHTADTNAASANSDPDNGFEPYARAQYEKAKLTEGDPALAFKAADDAVKQKMMDVKDQYKDYDSWTQQAVANRLQSTSYQLANKKANDQAIATRGYQDRTYKSEISLQQASVMDAGTLLNDKNIGDKSVWNSFDAQLAEIPNITTKHGLTTGQVIPADPNDPNSAPKYEPTLMNDIKVNQSRVIKDTFNALNSTGNTEAAAELMARYQDKLTAPDRTAMLTRGQAAITLNTASHNVADLQGLSNEDAMAKINDWIAEDPKAGLKTLNLYKSQQLAITSLKDNQSKDLYNHFAQQVMNNPNIRTVDDLHNLPDWQNSGAMSKMNPKQRLALENQITRPTDSKPAAFVEMTTAIQDGSIATKTPQQLLELKTGLNGHDAALAESAWKKARDPNQTSAVAGDKYMLSELNKELMGDKKNYKRDAYGHPTPATIDWMAKQRRDMMVDFAQYPPNATTADRLSAITNWVATKRRNEVYNGTDAVPQKSNGFQGTPQASPKAGVTAPSVGAPIKPVNVGSAQRYWQKTHSGQTWGPKSAPYSEFLSTWRKAGSPD